jgi:2-polyprenyl-3-methyl-5-hydroxy-6-metoxy-1,4-benzoquinol methylase
VCSGKFFDKPIVVYKNMPKAAQYLPSFEEIPLDNGVTLEICQCSQCGLVQLSNDPVPYYKEVIRAVGISDKMRNFRKKQFSEWLEKYHLEGSNILEVGCGHGEYLEIMKECGTHAFGFESSFESVVECKNKGLDVVQTYIDKDFQTNDNISSEKRFDAFFILNFLEHMPDPNSMFIGVKKVLKSGGIGLLEVPNFDMNIRNNLFSEFVTDHLFYFTQDSLSTLVKLNGFEILSTEEVWHGYMISMVIKAREELELSSFRGCEMRLVDDLTEYLNKHKRVAIWGAGHQALTVFSMADLSNRITYVVDSAPFKQGKYTPVTHLPIVAPSKILEDPVDAIIVMAGGYTDSVVTKIRNMNIPIKIAILDNYRVKEA